MRSTKRSSYCRRRAATFHRRDAPPSVSRREIGSAYPTHDDMAINIRGKDLVAGLPKAIAVPRARSGRRIREPVTADRGTGQGDAGRDAAWTGRRRDEPGSSSPAAARCCAASTSSSPRRPASRLRGRGPDDLRRHGGRPSTSRSWAPTTSLTPVPQPSPTAASQRRIARRCGEDRSTITASGKRSLLSRSLRSRCLCRISARAPARRAAVRNGPPGAVRPLQESPQTAIWKQVGLHRRRASRAGAGGWPGRTRHSERRTPN